MKKKVLYVLIFMFMFLPFTNVFAITKVTCGNVTGIPSKIPEITRLIVTLIEIAVPVILVISGSIDLLRGITAQKEDEIKKGQQLLIKKLITGVIVFFIVVIVKAVISLVADSNSKNIVDCIDCFLSSESSCIKESVDVVKPGNSGNDDKNPIKRETK